jgi:outer membrane protein OmpA-like peptidoglycan-associated protein/Tol biopolymer transport system component
MKTKLLLSICFVIFSSIVFSQDRKIAKAESYYEMHRYFDASQIYNELMWKNKVDAGTHPEVYRHGADANIRSKQYQQAKEALEYLSGTDQFNFEDAYTYIKLMLYMSRVEDARAMFSNKVVEESTDPRKVEIAHYFETNFIEDMKNDSLGSVVSLAEFNSELGDFSPAFHPKGIAFTSSRDKSMQTPWLVENTAFLSQYLYDKSTGKVKRIKGIKGKKHDGVAFYDSINKLYYYTKNLKRNKKLNLTTVGIFIYDELTKKEEAFPYNDPVLYVAHPSLSKDGKTLWFSSNRDGGLGGLDIWYSTKSDNGEWSTPVNAGDKVNTPGNEMFPYERNGKLYFASNGHPGLGGLDIFKAELQEKEVMTVNNAGYPLNSHGDDFSLIVDSTDTLGYFSSNRGDFIDRIYKVTLRNIKITVEIELVSNGVGNPPVAGATIFVKNENGETIDTLYSDPTGHVTFIGDPERQYTFEFSHPELMPMSEVFSTIGFTKSEVITKKFVMSEKQVAFFATVIDGDNFQKVPDATVEIKDLTSGKVTTVKTDNEGKILANIPKNSEFEVTAIKLGYNPGRVVFNTKEIGSEIKKDLTIRKTQDSTRIRLDNILYEFNKFNLTPESKAELDTLVAFLKENRDVTVEISSHTDCRGTNEYNQKLSQQRGQSCANYLISHGIKKDKLIVRNYGETKPLNKCVDGVTCTEEEYHVNRRTEFILNFPRDDKKKEAPTNDPEKQQKKK